MEPKEKALDLYQKFAVKWHNTTDDVKYYCIVAVEEIIESVVAVRSFMWDYTPDKQEPIANVDFWKQVKEEIQKL